MVLYNQTKKTIIAKDLKEAKSLSDKLFGLLIKKNPRSLVFKTRFGIHTFFLKEPIDVLVLNSQNKVVKAQTVKPNSILIYNPTHSTVIELPKDAIKNSNTKPGDELQIKNRTSGNS